MNKRLLVLLTLTLSLVGFKSFAGNHNGAVMDGGAAGFTWTTIGGDGQPVQYNILTFGGELTVGKSQGWCNPGSEKCYGYAKGTLYVQTTGTVCPNGCSYTGTITGASDLTETQILLPDGSTQVQIRGTFVGSFVDSKGVTHPNVAATFNSQTNPSTDGIEVISGGSLIVVLQDN